MCYFENKHMITVEQFLSNNKRMKENLNSKERKVSATCKPNS
jgi:hypothetical protein